MYVDKTLIKLKKKKDSLKIFSKKRKKKSPYGLRCLFILLLFFVSPSIQEGLRRDSRPPLSLLSVGCAITEEVNGGHLCIPNETTMLLFSLPSDTL